MRRVIKYRCGADLGHGRRCQNAVSRQGATCHLPGHSKRSGPRALKQAAKSSWNTAGSRGAPASKPAHRQERSLLGKLLSGEIRLPWHSPKMIQAKGKWKSPTDAAAEEIPSRRAGGRGSKRPVAKPSKVKAADERVSMGAEFRQGLRSARREITINQREWDKDPDDRPDRTDAVNAWNRFRRGKRR